ncbi:MAG: hypothetical protein ACXWAA_15145 [Methylobacter sp.]
MYKPVQDRYLIMDVDLDVGRHTHTAQVRPSKALLSKAEGCVARGGVAYRDVGKEREHDCTDAGGRAPTVGALGDAGAVAEERKLFRRIWVMFAGENKPVLAIA